MKIFITLAMGLIMVSNFAAAASLQQKNLDSIVAEGQLSKTVVDLSVSALQVESLRQACLANGCSPEAQRAVRSLLEVSAKQAENLSVIQSVKKEVDTRLLYKAEKKNKRCRRASQKNKPSCRRR